ncbi:MAG: mycofactocin biosynthesis peptidyl-dipeptidase MftE [Actinobacteria bacterium]|nr:mycofactocin biosynthesis peptidyl-dipeptidase MftE [Actinomycetota bacterium]
MSARLGELAWTDLRHAARPLLAVPIGSCEQHGPHLPLDTDTRVALTLADALVQSFEPGEVMVAPPLTISASGEHAGFPGTLSLGTSAVETVLVELVRSADWSAGVVLVNGHGGNVEAVRRAVSTLTREGRRVLAWWPHVTGSDAHAGHTETSLMLAIAPELVHLDRAEIGRVEHVTDLIDELRAIGVRGVSPNGVLGDPRGASAAHGRSLIARLTIDLVAAVDEWRSGPAST